MHVKGMEIPGYDARALPAMALGYAVGTRGACHNRSGAYEVDFGGDGRDPVAGAIETEDRMAVMDSLIVCKFLRGCFRDFYAEAAEMLEAAAGRRVDLREAGARIVDLKKAYNEREGWTPEEDRLPSRLDSPEVRERVRAYYRARGWTDGGRLCEERRRDLGLASAYGSDFMRCTAAKASRGSA
jgi:aldehyde:ferredoxin oxidoreductase